MTNQNIIISLSLHILIPRTYGLPQFAARIGNAYSSTNGDLANTNLTDTDIQQNLASDEYLDDYDETKDVRAWARAGLNFTTLFEYMPPRMTDTLNQNAVNMILVSVSYSLFTTSVGLSSCCFSSGLRMILWFSINNAELVQCRKSRSLQLRIYDR